MVRYTFFSPITVLLGFVVLGPFIWFIGFLIVDFDLLARGGDPLTLFLGALWFSLLGGVGWWGLALNVGFWLATWVPTVLAALLYWAVMTWICQRKEVAFRSKLHWVILNSVICAVISAAVFFLVAVVPTLPPNIKGVTSFASWVAVVGVVGALLGLFFGVLAKPTPNRRIDTDRFAAGHAGR